jgi:hypothetical protein
MKNTNDVKIHEMEEITKDVGSTTEVKHIMHDTTDGVKKHVTFASDVENKEDFISDELKDSLVDEELQFDVEIVQTADEFKCQFYENVEQLDKEMHELALFGFLASCLVLPSALQTDEDSPYESKLFQTRFHELLDELDDDGLFEHLRTARLS